MPAIIATASQQQKIRAGYSAVCSVGAEPAPIQHPATISAAPASVVAGCWIGAGQ